jgi:hypothetical protein
MLLRFLLHKWRKKDDFKQSSGKCEYLNVFSSSNLLSDPCIVCRCVCMHACMHACMYLCMYVQPFSAFPENANVVS